MVMDTAFVAGTLASFLMNGACCVYQMNREDELRQELRQEIRREWHHQRKREVEKQHETAKQHRKEFEDRYQQLLMRQDEASYTSTHKFFARTSPTPSRDPPSEVAQLMASRSSSILDEEEEEEDDELLYVTEAGSHGTMEDISIP